jgi:lysozyme family protein
MALVFANEGGYCNVPGDAGGETKYGISKRSYPNVDIKNLTKEQASEIYKTDFYDKCKIDAIHNDLVAIHVFDFAINSGISRAVKVLQSVCGVKADGIIGMDTITKVNSRDMSLNYINARIDFYKNIGVGTNAKFLQGWLNRVSNTTKSV